MSIPCACSVLLCGCVRLVSASSHKLSKLCVPLADNAFLQKVYDLVAYTTSILGLVAARFWWRGFFDMLGHSRSRGMEAFSTGGVRVDCSGDWIRGDEESRRLVNQWYSIAHGLVRYGAYNPCRIPAASPGEDVHTGDSVLLVQRSSFRRPSWRSIWMPQSRGPSDGLKAGWGPAAGPQARLLIIHARRSSVKEATLVSKQPKDSSRVPCHS